MVLFFMILTDRADDAAGEEDEDEDYDETMLTMMMSDTAVRVHDGCDDGGDQFSRLSSQLRLYLWCLTLYSKSDRT